MSHGLPNRAVLSLVTLAALAATVWQGATEHLPALALRAVVAACVVAVWPPSPTSLRRRDVAAPALAVLAVLAGFLAAGDPGLALQSLVSAVLVSAFYVALLAAREDHSSTVVVAAVAIGSVHALWAVAERLTGSTRASAGFFNPNDLAAFLAPLAVVMLDRAVVQRRLPAILTSALLVVGLVSTGSRSGALALLMGGGVALAGRMRRPWQRLALAGAAVAILAVGIDRWRGKGDSLAYARLDIWKASTSLALAYPLGVGLGGYGEAMRSHGVPLEGWVRFPRTASHAHSEVLNAWAEMGWLGLAAVLLPALFLAHVFRRSRARAAEWGVLAAFAVPALVSNSLHVPPVAFLAAAWAAGVVRRDASAAAMLHLPGGRRGRWLAGAVAFGVVLLAVPGALSRAAMDRAAHLRAAGELASALDAARWGERLAPWSMSAALLAESLRYLNGEPAAEVGARLIELAEAAPQDPRPLERAVWLLERHASHEPKGWAAIAELRTELARRDPTNALFYDALGQAHARAGDHEAARVAHEQAMAVEPHCAAALAHVALLAHDRGDPGTAASLAARAWQAHGQSRRWYGHGRAVLSLPPGLQTMLEQHGYRSP